MKPATVWRSLFLGVTALAIGMEVWASFDGDDSTDPWTALIVRHIPAEVALFLIGGLSLWLGVHFGLRYYRKARDRERQPPEDRP